MYIVFLVVLLGDEQQVALCSCLFRKAVSLGLQGTSWDLDSGGLFELLPSGSNP